MIFFCSSEFSYAFIVLEIKILLGNSDIFES